MNGIKGILDYINNEPWIIILFSVIIFTLTEYNNYKKKNYLKIDNPRIKEILRYRNFDKDDANKKMFYCSLGYIALCVLIMIFVPKYGLIVGFFAYILLARGFNYISMGFLFNKSVINEVKTGQRTVRKNNNPKKKDVANKK